MGAVCRLQQGLRMVNATGPFLRPLCDVERDHVLSILAACHDNRTLAARILDIDRKTLYRMLLRWSDGGGGDGR